MAAPNFGSNSRDGNGTNVLTPSRDNTFTLLHNAQGTTMTHARLRYVSGNHYTNSGMVDAAAAARRVQPDARGQPATISILGGALNTDCTSMTIDIVGQDYYGHRFDPPVTNPPVAVVQTTPANLTAVPRAEHPPSPPPAYARSNNPFRQG